MQMSDVISAMELSAAAYHRIQPVFPGGALMMVDDPQSDVQCYLRWQGNSLTITFRGSNSGQDWKTNFTYKKKVIPYGNTQSKIRVHSGFLEAYKSVRNTIHDVITRDLTQIRISGHSQGGALAVLCGVDLEYNFPDRDYEVIVFGAPRVGNLAFKKSYNKRIFKTLRVENGNDIVTKVPFAFMGYHHVGAAVHIGSPRIPGLFSFTAHYPHEYYKNLFQLLHG